MLENYSQELQKILKKENITTGQKISIKNGNTEYDGFLMPKSAGDPNIIVLKLANGYNIGLAFAPGMNIRKQQDKRTLEKRKAGSGKYKPDPGKPTITLLHTGGTFASRVDYKTGAAYPAFTPEELFFAIPEAGKIANFNTRVVFQMFSEDMEPEHWILLAKKIAQEIEETKPDGIIVTHGTDTMIFTTAAVSLMLQNLSIPVIFVGAQRSSDRSSSDAWMNLMCAAQFIAKSDFSGVALCMHGSVNDDFCYILDGLHIKKMHSSRRDSFRSVDVLPYAKAFPDGTVEYLRNDYQRRDKARKLNALERFDRRVAIVKIYPGVDHRIFDFLHNSGFRGVIIEGTGLGNAPVNVIDDYTKHHDDFLAAIKRTVDKGVVVCMTSQCAYGKAGLNVYSSGRRLLEAGVVPIASTTEAAYVKLGWALAHTKDAKEVKKMMLTNYAGEILERIDPRAFLF
ncbi:MAG: Glu-tRNA(Gln) amidotransferase subunit GatD [Candidatus Aenigmarchaeota archaeon]|nr:Glu-tRNA(Gln) amidotransferase subunit GatD [Candidatus Aenigmarchaeota archaeon]